MSQARPNSYHKKVIHWLQSTYAIDDVVYSVGGNHPRINFIYDGREHQVTLHHDARETNALALKKQDIRRELGRPFVPKPITPKRSLEEMTMELEAKAVESFNPLPLPKPAETAQTYAIRAACYDNRGKSGDHKQVRFVLPIETHDALFTGNPALKITQLDREMWELRVSANGVQFGKAGQRAVLVVKSREEAFGSSPAELTTVEPGVWAIHVPMATRRAVALREPQAVATTPAAQPAVVQAPVELAPLTPLPPAVPPTLAENTALMLEQLSRQALTAIRTIEGSTPYRLIRTTAGAWEFRAPTLRLPS